MAMYNEFLRKEGEIMLFIGLLVDEESVEGLVLVERIELIKPCKSREL